jgi:hypothetical protein
MLLFYGVQCSVALCMCYVVTTSCLWLYFYYLAPSYNDLFLCLLSATPRCPQDTRLLIVCSVASECIAAQIAMHVAPTRVDTWGLVWCSSRRELHRQSVAFFLHILMISSHSFGPTFYLSRRQSVGPWYLIQSASLYEEDRHCGTALNGVPGRHYLHCLGRTRVYRMVCSWTLGLHSDMLIDSNAVHVAVSAKSSFSTTCLRRLSCCVQLVYFCLYWLPLLHRV